MRLTDRITILVVPRADAQILSIRMPVAILAGTIVLFLAGLIGLGTAAFQYAGRVDRERQIARLTGENTALSHEVGEIRRDVGRLRADLHHLAELEREIRISSDLPPVDPDVAQVGVGGPGGGVGPQPAAHAATDLRGSLDGLMRQARFQRASFTEVAATLTERREELARIPSILPVPDGYLTSAFGNRIDPFTGQEGMHYGVDIAGVRGEPVVAAAAGVVRSSRSRTGYGLTVEIDHGNGLTTRYSHNSKLLVRAGERVERGQPIAAIGSTGRATAAHVHYEVHRDGRPVDPKRFILSSRVIYD